MTGLATLLVALQYMAETCYYDCWGSYSNMLQQCMLIRLPSLHDRLACREMRNMRHLYLQAAEQQLKAQRAATQAAKAEKQRQLEATWDDA